jgi:uncharacterized protein YjlB
LVRWQRRASEQSDSRNVCELRITIIGSLRHIIDLKAGDVAVLPAGTGHKGLLASADFLVISAYPPSGTYDVCTTSEDHERAVKTIPKDGKPRKDPVYGNQGPLLKAWNTR